MPLYRLMDGASGRPGVGSTGTQPPATVASFSGNYIPGLVFRVTSAAMFTGYYWWVPGNGDTGAIKCALWQLTGLGTGNLVSGSVVTSGTLTTGQWNFVPLTAPVAVTPGAPYCAAIGFATVIGFPSTHSQFGAANLYGAGIVNGPLSAPASNVGSGDFMPQQPFTTTGGTDPSLVIPASNDVDDLLWVDVQISAPSQAIIPQLVAMGVI